MRGGSGLVPLSSLLVVTVASCAARGAVSVEPPVEAAPAGVSAAGGSRPTEPLAATTPAPEDGPECARRVPVYELGRPVGEVCPDAPSGDLVVLDLSDEWVPMVLSRSSYRPHYVALADEQPRTADGERVDGERFLELYGVVPSLRVLTARATDAAVHACHDAVDPTPLRALGEDVRAFGTTPEGWSRRRRRVAHLHARLDAERAALGLGRIEELPEEGTIGRQRADYLREKLRLDAVAAAQAHLSCAGLLRRHRPGTFDGPTFHALSLWQRQHAIISNGTLDAPTRAAMTMSSRELVLRATLRALRERVVDATGLVEDGTAASEPGTVLGRVLDAPEVRATSALPALPGAAPDLVSAATEAAAVALGLTDPDAVAGVLATLAARSPDDARIAVRLPPPPPWHGAAMDLRAEIDRGDVRYGGVRPGERRPTLTLFARHEGRDVALVRWSTTIGGFQDERLSDGRVVRRYKESPVGPRLWRDVVAAPAWLPPPSAPDEELVRRTPSGDWEPDHALFGPGYRSAYGLVMAMHLRVLEPAPDGTPRFFDEGVRSHGSVSYRSILTGHSHGCHRLFNHLALRLGGFLVRHRPVIERGEQRVRYSRLIAHDGREVTLRMESRGYLYELSPPVPIEVLPGTFHGRRPRGVRAAAVSP